MTEHENHGHPRAGHHDGRHGPHSRAHADHSHTTDAELAETLDLDALLLGSYLDEATEWAAGLAGRVPETVIDVGAGSGVGTLALARRFPAAQLTALDRSAEMLAATLAAAGAHGLDGRVAGLQADLDQGWPEGATADLMWASSSLHELGDPERAMAAMFEALNPGGLLVVVEMDSLPSFLPDSLPEGSAVEPGLETRLHAALGASGWNQHPDWTAGLEGAGFAVERRHFPTGGSRAAGSPTAEPAARYARTFLGRIRGALAGTASAGDLSSLDLLLGDGPESLERRGDLVVRGNRTGWAARKP